jgi:hypothetical protein
MQVATPHIREAHLRLLHPTLDRQTPEASSPRRPPPTTTQSQGTATQRGLCCRAPPTGRRAPHTGSPRRPTKCPPTAGRKAPEQAAPLPHHPGPAVAADRPTPIRPPYEVAPPWNPRSGHGNAGSGRPTTRRRGRRTTPVSHSNGPRRSRPPRSTGARRKGPTAAFRAGVWSPGDPLGRRHGGTRRGGAAAARVEGGACHPHRRDEAPAPGVFSQRSVLGDSESSLSHSKS